MKVDPEVPRAHRMVMIDKVAKKSSVIIIGDTAILFFDSSPVALCSSEIVSMLDRQYSAGEMKVINDFSHMEELGFRYPQLRVPAGDFDYALGQTFTRTGLLLTRRPKEQE